MFIQNLEVSALMYYSDKCKSWEKDRKKQNIDALLFFFSTSSSHTPFLFHHSLSPSFFFRFTFLESLHTYTHYIHIKITVFPLFCFSLIAFYSSHHKSIVLFSHKESCVFPLSDSLILVRSLSQE
ncbi:hypothetical protein L1887_05852 [Cichorium endivia]|nr:hypothetical protein L1887_05852 [Cichorium endivia]